MHRALAIVEVLEAVIRQLANDDASLASLGQTCQTFFTPAMAALWSGHTYRTIGHLADIVLGREHEGLTSTPSMAQRWTRFDMYARFARRLEISSISTHESAWALEDQEAEERLESAAREKLLMLAFLRGSWPLLPNLRKLTYDVMKPQHLVVAMALLTPSLERVHIEGHMEAGEMVQRGWAVAAARLLNKLGDENSYIHALTMKGFNDIQASLTSPLIRVVTKSEALTVFRSDTAFIDHRALLALGSLIRLRNLEIVLGMVDDITAFSSLSTTSFCSLESLHLRSQDLSLSTAFIKAISSNLQILNFMGILSGPVRVMDIRTFCSAISANSAALVELGLVIREDGGRRGYPVPWHSFEPLFARSANILKLSIILHSKSAFEFCDSDVVRMSQALPAVKSLLIHWDKRDDDGNSGLHDESAITLGTLIAFASHCNSLRDLRIPHLHVGIPPPIPAISPRTDVLSLHVDYDTPMKSPQLVAAFLGVFWPSISISVGSRRARTLVFTGEEEYNWFKVQDTLSVIRCYKVIDQNRGASLAAVKGQIPFCFRRSLVED